MAPSLPRPNPSLEDGTIERKTKTGLPSSFFLKMYAFLLLPDPVLNHQHLQLDDSASHRNGDENGGRGAVRVSGAGDSFQMPRDDLE